MYCRYLRLILAVVSMLLADVTPTFAQSWTQRQVAPEDEANVSGGTSGWGLNCVACSGDGSKIVAGSFGGPICVSTNSGLTWQANTPNEDWSSVACSADGTKMVGVCSFTSATNGYGASTIFTSSDSGGTWTAQNWTEDTNHFMNWGSVASSADGTKLVALGGGVGGFSSSDPARADIGIYLSTDSGLTWQLSEAQIPTNSWNAVASSADGSTLAAAGSHVDFATETEILAIYVSRDFGATWVAANVPNVYWKSITMSADGSKMVAVTEGSGGQIYTSADSGGTWTLQTNTPSQPLGWDAVASSADGTRLLAGGGFSNGRIYTSLDSGVTWFSTNNEPTVPTVNGIRYAGWEAAASSSDGLKLVAIPYNLNDIYTLQMTESTNVTGHVFCSCDSNAIAGASVQIGTNFVTCDNDGAYTVSNLAAGTYTATVGAGNYETLTTNLTVPQNQPIFTNDFYLTNSTLAINAIYDPLLQALPGFDIISNTINLACQVYGQNIANPICVTILFGSGGGLGSSLTRTGSLPYTQFLADLLANTNMSANDVTALSTLPLGPGTGLNSNTQVRLTPANLKAIGETDLANSVLKIEGGLDSVITLNFSILNSSRPGLNPANYDLQSTVTHEIDEVLGIGGNGSTLDEGALPNNGVGPLDLFRYSNPGARSFTLAANTSCYFSIDGGDTPLVHFNQYGGGSDYGDWGDGINPADGMGNVPTQVQDAFGTPGSYEDLGANEFIALDIVGYTLMANTTIQGTVFSTNSFAFSWPSLPGQTYQVQYTTNLSQKAWNNLGNPVVATGMTQAITDTNAMGGQRYYRIIVVLPPHSALTIANRQPSAKAQAGTVVPEVVTHRYLPHQP